MVPAAVIGMDKSTMRRSIDSEIEAAKKNIKEKTLFDKLLDAGHYMSITYTGPCSYGDHYTVECDCGYKNEVYGGARDIVEHTLEVMSQILAGNK